MKKKWQKLQKIKLRKNYRFAFWYSYAWGSGYNIRGHAIDGCEKMQKA